MPENNSIKIYLSDIERSIGEIFDFLPEKRNFLEFQKDLKTRKAVERNIEIIGEAMNRIIGFSLKYSSEAVLKVIFRAELQIPLNATRLYYNYIRSAGFAIQP